MTIKSKIMDWLGISTLLELSISLETRITRLEEKVSTLERENSKLKYENKLIKQSNDNIMNQFNISADIGIHGDDSWAVLSIKGKPEYVKFINLNNKDMRSINEYLKQFERNNRIIDSPFKFW